MQPSLVGRGDDRDAAFDLLRRRQRERIAHHENGWRDARGKGMVALRDAASHLKIDGLIVEWPEIDEHIGVWSLLGVPEDELLAAAEALGAKA